MARAHSRFSLTASLSKLWISRALVLIAGLAVAAGCGEDGDGGTDPNPDFDISLSPAALSIEAGGTGTTTVTLTRTDFTGPVTLSLQLALGGTLDGVTGTFTPAAPTGGSATLTVTVDATVAPDIYEFSVFGIGSAGTRSTQLILTVGEVPDYSLSLAPAAITLDQGVDGNIDVTITRTNFTGGVTLSLGNAPVGVTGVFIPAAPSGASSVLTLSVGAAVAPGVYDLTVDGTGTAGDRSTPLTLTVTALAADYSLSLNPAAFTVAPGAGGTTDVTLTRVNFTGAVTLSLGNAPAGITGSFSIPAPTGNSSVLALSVGAGVTPGIYNLTVDGAGTPGNRSTPLTLTVSVAPDYALSLAPSALSIVQGANDVSTVTITRSNFTGAVTLSLGNAPAGVTGAFNPAAPTGTSSTLTVTVGAAVAPGVYNLTVDGTGTAGNRSTPLTLTVTATPDYALSLAPAALSIEQGDNDVSTVTITRTNFTGAVTLSLGNAPAGVTGAFNPAAPTGTSSTLTVTVGAAVAPGVYNLTVDGTGTPGNRSTPLTLTVTAAPDYALSLTPASLSIAPGANDISTVTINRTNFTGAVTLSLGSAPAGVTGAFNPAAPTGTSSTLTVTVGAAVAPGVYNLTVDGTGTPGNRSTPLTLTVTATADYSLSLNPASLSIAPGANDNSAVTITRTNFTGAVTLSLGNAPAGVTGAFNPAAPTGTSSTLTVTVGGAVAPGVYNLTVDGAGGPGNRSTPLTLTVTGGGGGSVTVDFSGCAVGERALWVAYQDGAGPWIVVTGVSDVYSFNIAAGNGGLAYVVEIAGNTETTVSYQTQAEFTAGPMDICPPAPPAGKTINGTAAGIGPTDQTFISLGGGVAFPSFGALQFQITNVANGTHDMVGFRRSLIGGAEAAIIRRDLNIADNGSVGTVDFGGAEAFVPATALITVGGLVGGESILQSMGYQVGASCTGAILYSGGLGGATFTASGIPAGQQRASDFHAISISAIGASDFRSITEYFHTLSARTVTLGAVMPAPTVTSLGGPYKRLQAVYTLPGDYQNLTGFGYTDGGGTRSVAISATFGYLGGTAVTLSLPDYSALAGWDNSWPPASASTGDWSASGSSSLTGLVCTENASVKLAVVSGTF